MPPDVVDTLEQVHFDDLRCEELRDVPRAGHWPEGFIYHFYRPELSTRSVEISFEKDEFLVRLLANASGEDYELAFAFVDAVCAITKTGPIKTSELESLSVDQFRKEHDQAWVDDRREREASELFGVAGDDGALVRLQGPTRDVFIGPQMVERLGAPDAHRLEAAMRDVLYLDETAHPPAPMVERQVSGTRLMCAVIGKGRASLVERCDLFAFEGPDHHHLVALKDIDRVLPGRNLVDEVQFTLKPLEGEAWEQTLSRAENRAIDLDEFGKPKRWWSFWK